MKKLRYIFALLVIFLSISNIAKAQDIAAFSIVPIYPDNQVVTTKGYYDLKVNSGERQTLKMRITNNKDKELSLDITSASAYTDPTGGISYSSNIISPEKNLLDDNIQLANYISAPSNIIVKPNSTLEVSIVVTTPNIKSGTLLGGIIFTIKDEPAKSQPIPGKNKANFEINTATAYVFGIQINLPTAEIPRLSFGNAGFLPKELAAYIELINDNYAILENISGTYKVTNSSSVELFSGKFGPFSMAPKTKIEYPMKWNSQTLEPGNYILSISATANNKEISTQKSFTIQDKQVTEAQSSNKLPQINAKNGIPIWIWISLIFVVAIIMYSLGRKKNKK